MLKDTVSIGDSTVEITEGRQKVKLLVGVATLGISYEFFESWNEFWTDMVRSAKFEIACSFKHRMPAFIAQEELAVEAVESGATHLLLIDDDILEFSVLDLMKLLESDLDMVGGVMLTKKFPFHGCAMRRLDDTKPVIEHAHKVTGFDMYEVPAADRKGVKPVDLISFGFTLFRTDLFKKMGEPYFLPDLSKIKVENCHKRYLTFTDSIFCDKVKGLGLTPYAHFGVPLNHNGITKENVNGWIEIYQKSNKLTQPGLKMEQEEFLKYKMIVKEKLVEAERKFHSESINKLKWYRESTEGEKRGEGYGWIKEEDRKEGSEEGKQEEVSEGEDKYKEINEKLKEVRDRIECSTGDEKDRTE